MRRSFVAPIIVAMGLFSFLIADAYSDWHRNKINICADVRYYADRASDASKCELKSAKELNIKGLTSILDVTPVLEMQDFSAMEIRLLGSIFGQYQEHEWYRGEQGIYSHSQDPNIILGVFLEVKSENKKLKSRISEIVQVEFEKDNNAKNQ